MCPGVMLQNSHTALMAQGTGWGRVGCSGAVGEQQASFWGSVGMGMGWRTWFPLNKSTREMGCVYKKCVRS